MKDEFVFLFCCLLLLWSKIIIILILLLAGIIPLALAIYISLLDIS